jgi:hypothetical protein
LLWLRGNVTEPTQQIAQLFLISPFPPGEKFPRLTDSFGKHTQTITASCFAGETTEPGRTARYCFNAAVNNDSKFVHQQPV